MEPVKDITGTKRKHSPDISPPGHPITVSQPSRIGDNAGMGNVTQINYLTKARTEGLKLVEGDSETFGDVLGSIDEYEGVLQRHESLAANLGAKLVGPLLLKSFERLFDGPIKITQSSFALEQSPLSWLDIVAFARSKTPEFCLSDDLNGGKSCRFWVKGGQIEISEDDYRLIMSGGPERMIPSLPLPEDDSAELATLNILEARLTMLIKKADAVASKARQLNYHLKGRKTAVISRKNAQLANAGNSNAAGETRAFSPQPFSAVKTGRTSNPVNGEPSNLQLELLEQYLSADRRHSGVQQALPKSTRVTTSDNESLPHNFNGNQMDAESRCIPQPLSSGPDEMTDGRYRVFMATKIEKLRRGDPIYPPCDRCRRLKFDCTKHLTACSACTKKHAKCSWKDVTGGDIDNMLHGESQNIQVVEEGEIGVANTERIADPNLRNGNRFAVGGLSDPHLGNMSSRNRNRNSNVAERLPVDRQAEKTSDGQATAAAAAAATGTL